MARGRPPERGHEQIHWAIHLSLVLQGVLGVGMAIVAVYLTDGYALAVFVPLLAYLAFVLTVAGIRHLRRRAVERDRR